MSTTIPAGRLQLSQVAARQYAAMFRLSTSVEIYMLGSWNRLNITTRLEPGQFDGRAVAARPDRS